MGVVTGGGGGGGTPLAGATVVAGGSIFIGKNDSVVTYDDVPYDTDGFYDSVNHRLTVPAGKAGVYLYGFALFTPGIDAGAGDYLQGTLSVHSIVGDAYKLGAYAAYPTLNHSDTVGVSASGVATFGAGDYVTLLLDFNSGASPTLNVENTQLFLVRLGVVA